MHGKPTQPAVILIVEDQESNLRVLERMLRRAGYAHVVGTTDSRQALALFLEHRPDLVLLDLRMPHLDGFAVLEQLRPHVPRSSYLPIVVITADISAETKQKVLSMGAKDFVGKPFDGVEIQLRIRNLLEARSLYLQLQRQNEALEQRVRERTHQLEQAQVEILERLALAAEFRDDATHDHTHRVGELSARLARKLGLPEPIVGLIQRAAPLHDLGKIALPDQVLLKYEGLTPDEFALVKSHTRIGARILAGSHHPLLQLAEQIALTHHEHWDGSGYSPGLAGEQIPLVSRIVAVADVFDALTNERPYKEAWSIPEALEEIERQSGRQFDPRVVEALVGLMRDDGALAASGAAPARVTRRRR